MRRFVNGFRLGWLATVAALWLVMSTPAHAQETGALAETNPPAETLSLAEPSTSAQAVNPVKTNLFAISPIGAAAAEEPVKQKVNWFKRPVESELIVEGLASVGNYKIFATSDWEKLYTGGLEYDRQSWGTFIGSQMDYVAEILPLMILREPAVLDKWGNPLSTARQTLVGVGVTPIGIRMMWRNKKNYRPYFIVKGGMLAFNKKALSPNATYENFTLQTGFGLQAKLTRRLDMRVTFSDFHFSNAFIVPLNPGLDVMNFNVGIVCHLGQHRQ
jgi:hypothetical protein